MTKRVFITADHGLALVYFLQSDTLSALLSDGVEVVLFTDDEARPVIKKRFGQPGLIIEGLRIDRCRLYSETRFSFIQRWLHLFRYVGGSQRVNGTAMDGNYRLAETGILGRGRVVLPFMRFIIWLMRRSRLVRDIFVHAQNLFKPNIYADLFERYQPAMVIASTPGWRFDRYLIREAAARHIPTVAVIVGWDNPSSYRLSGAPVDYATCWSDIQKEELVLGADWKPEKVHIGGIPSYDGYFKRSWIIPREQYFHQHDLDPKRKLLAYACSFETFHPNFPNIAAIVELVNGEKLAEPCQLLIRLHPNHFIKGSRFEGEANSVREFIKGLPYIHIVEPVSLGGGLGHYSGEDMPEKTSMMAWSDVFLTVYSTMVVEAAIHDRPIVSVTIDKPGGWNMKGVYSLPLTAIGEWPTHQRFRKAGAGRVAASQEQVRELVNFYLLNPSADREKRRQFVADECTFTDGSAGKRTGEYLLSLFKGTR